MVDNPSNVDTKDAIRHVASWGQHIRTTSSVCQRKAVTFTVDDCDDSSSLVTVNDNLPPSVAILEFCGRLLTISVTLMVYLSG